MTVKELIQQLTELDETAVIYRNDDDQGATKSTGIWLGRYGPDCFVGRVTVRNKKQPKDPYVVVVD